MTDHKQRPSRWQRLRRRRTPAAAPVVAPAPEPVVDHAPPAPAPALEPAVAGPGQPERATLRDRALQAHLEQFGFAVVPAFDEEVLAEVRAATERLGAAPDDPQVAINWSFHSRSSEHKHQIKHEILPIVQPVLDEVLDDHEVYLTTYITKWPGPNSAFAPHLDPTLVDERSFRGVTIWIPLEDTGVIDGKDNGMLFVVPGSHRFSSVLRVPDVDHFPFAEHERAIIERHGVGVPVRAGEALIFDNRIIHHSRPNETDRPRVVLSFGVRPREARCVHLRTAAPGEIDLYEIPDDFYIDVLPAEQHLWASPQPPVARLAQVRESWTPEEFDRMCAAVPPVSMATVAPDGSWRDPGVFCALCGSSEGLEAEERTGRNNAQLVCPRCRAELAEAGAEPADALP